jgi:hypothetical protein
LIHSSIWSGKIMALLRDVDVDLCQSLQALSAQRLHQSP